MKKLFVSKKIISTISLILACLIVFQFIAPRPVEASIGGALLTPVKNLAVFLADGVISILQTSLMTSTNQDVEPFIHLDLSSGGANWLAIALGVIAGVFITALAVGAVAATGGTILFAVAAAGGFIIAAFNPQLGETVSEILFDKENFVISNIMITPEAFLKNQIGLFDVNFFTELANDGNPTYELANTLRNIISGTYKTIRDISIIAMSIIIVYIAIRMLMSLNPREKSRYKEGFVNCIIGLILIVGMHYIMSISTSVISYITNGIGVSDLQYKGTTEDFKNEIKNDSSLQKKYAQGETIGISGENIYAALVEEANGKKQIKDEYKQKVAIVEGKKEVLITASNFMESARYKAQKLYTGNAEKKADSWDHIGWAFVYILLVILTLAFTWMYAKRLLYMAGLTMLAPIVGVMYPINRADGSRAHTLNLWFKEYMGNLIIQPVQLLLYTLLIGGAMYLALNNPIYVIIALIGLNFIEKLLKDLIGIQDTRAGGLQDALRDTNRALKTANDTAKRTAKAVGNATKKAAGAIDKAARKHKSNKGEEQDEEEEKDVRTEELSGNSQEEQANLKDDNEALDADPYLEDKSFEATDRREAEALLDEEEALENGYGEPESLYDSDEEMAEQLREQGLSDEEIDEALGIRNDLAEPEKVLDAGEEALEMAGEALEDGTDQPESLYNSDEEMAEQLREQGLSEEEIDEALGIRNAQTELEALTNNSEELEEKLAGGNSESASRNLGNRVLETNNSGLPNGNENSSSNPRIGNKVTKKPSFMSDRDWERTQKDLHELKNTSGINAVTDGRNIYANFNRNSTGNTKPGGEMAMAAGMEYNSTAQNTQKIKMNNNTANTMATGEGVTRGAISGGGASTNGFTGASAHISNSGATSQVNSSKVEEPTLQIVPGSGNQTLKESNTTTEQVQENKPQMEVIQPTEPVQVSAPEVQGTTTQVVEQAPAPEIQGTTAQVVEQAPAPEVQGTTAQVVEQAPAPEIQGTTTQVVEQAPTPGVQGAPVQRISVTEQTQVQATQVTSKTEQTQVQAAQVTSTTEQTQRTITQENRSSNSSTMNVTNTTQTKTEGTHIQNSKLESSNRINGNVSSSQSNSKESGQQVEQVKEIQKKIVENEAKKQAADLEKAEAQAREANANQEKQAYEENELENETSTAQFVSDEDAENLYDDLQEELGENEKTEDNSMEQMLEEVLQKLKEAEESRQKAEEGARRAKEEAEKAEAEANKAALERAQKEKEEAERKVAEAKKEIERREEQRKQLEKQEKVAGVVNTVAGVAGKTAGVYGNILDGVLNMAVDAATGNAAGIVNDATRAFESSVNTVTGHTGGGLEARQSTRTNTKSEKMTEDVQYLMKEGHSQERAKFVEALCRKAKDKGVVIDNRRDKAAIAKVLKDIGDKNDKMINSLIFKAKEYRINGKSKEDYKKLIHDKGASNIEGVLLQLFDELKG